MKREFIIILLLLIICIPAVKALLQPGGFTSQDMTHHVIRQINMDQLLSEGQFPPRWSGDLNKGFGYPVFLFNYPLPPLIGEIFVKIDFGYVGSVKGVLFLSIIISTLGMYLFLRSLLGSKLSAFLGAVFFLYAPIRFIFIYVSAAVGAALAMAFIPFIFWAIAILDKKPKLGILVGSISLAGLILSHNVTTLIFMPAIIGFGILRSKGNLSYLRYLSYLGLLGVGLAAFFWLPAILEKQYIRWDLIFGNFYKDYFPSFGQLFHSPWGYGLDHPGTDQDGMSFQIGLAQILVILLCCGLVIVRKVKEVRVIGGFALIFFLLAIFLTQEISLPIWEHLPLLNMVQFPWRFLSLACFAAAISAGLLVKYLPFRKIAFVFLLIIVLYANRNHLNINQVFNPGVGYYLDQKPTTTSFDEDLPLWAVPPKTDAKGKLEFVEGSGQINVLENKSVKVKAQINTTTSGQLRLNQLYFPGWQLSLDEKPIRFDYQQKDQNQGLPVFQIPAGSHTFLAEFRDTWDRSLGNWISIISLIIWVGLLINPYVKAQMSNVKTRT